MLARSILASLVWATLAMTPTRAADLPPQLLPVIGGSGGSLFRRECGAGKVLTGFRYTQDSSLTAIGLLCRPVNADGTLGDMTAVGDRAGIARGEGGQVYCQPGQVVGGTTIYYTTVVIGVHMRCHAWKPSTRRMAETYAMGVAIGRRDIGKAATTSCAADTQPVVGMRGRAELVVDALGFTCDEP